MGRVVIDNPEAIVLAASDDLLQVADGIAVKARDRYRRHELKTADPRMGVVAERIPDGARTLTHNGFAPLDEFDNGGSGFLGPSAAMRSAAAEAGRFEPA